MIQGIVCGLSEYVKIVEEITHIRGRMIRTKPSIGNEEPRMTMTITLRLLI